MLVLTRKLGQKLIIGDNIVVTVLDVRGDTVKIGIDAPRSVSIFREELLQEVRDANQKAQPKATHLDSISLPNSIKPATGLPRGGVTLKGPKKP